MAYGNEKSGFHLNKTQKSSNKTIEKYKILKMPSGVIYFVK